MFRIAPLEDSRGSVSFFWRQLKGDLSVHTVLFYRSVMLDRAETLLHDHYAGKDYWDVSAVMGLNESFLNNVGVIIIRSYLKTCLLELKGKLILNLQGILIEGILSVTSHLCNCVFFDVDPSQHGLCQAPASHRRRLQGKLPELNR